MKTPEAGDIWRYTWHSRGGENTYFLLVEETSDKDTWVIMDLGSGHISNGVISSYRDPRWGWLFMC